MGSDPDPSYLSFRIWKIFRIRIRNGEKKPHLKVLVLLAIIIVIAFAVALRVEEAPAAALEESLRVVHNGLHDLGPVEGLDPLRVLDITRVQPFLNKIKIV